MKVGLDIGSTTIKCVVLNDENKLIYKTYERHYSQIVKKIAESIEFIKENFLDDTTAEFAISGSAGMGVAEMCNLPFVQEVYATKIATNFFNPNIDIIIELGGEDAKILFLSGGLEVRMNGSCAGGTGAFIDQMATLLGVTPDEMNELAKNYEKIYTIASRCGVFAKSDIQPLLNQGARKNDISASIFSAVVNQTIAGLAQGRDIKGNVLYLGGPLTFLSQLRLFFDKTLSLEGNCPENSLYYVAIGAALSVQKNINFDYALKNIKNYKAASSFAHNPPLFKNESDYLEFKTRHNKSSVNHSCADIYKGNVYIGIDAGSTTIKMVVMGENDELLLSHYQPNSGNPVPIVKDFLVDFYRKYPDIHIASCAVTGYGEEIIKNAFCIDYGIVETVAHFYAAKKFMPDVEFVIDIGGQDIKCFKIHNGTIDNIFLNEACSSGCGSFLQTFANALGYSIEEFAKLGLFSLNPVDLGSRCTVFMNSSVKQAQKDGALIEDISAGLSLSVVKNALYKVIRTSSPDELGKKIVVQGGTFLNDAVLRAFEQELGIDVIRPDISGLMGAYGAALYAKNKGGCASSIITHNALLKFTHKINAVTCKLCNNNCRLTVNVFENDIKYIGGNKCERPITKKQTDDSLNIYSYKRTLLNEYMSASGKRGVIGLPLGLNMYELLPFWHTFFTYLDFGVTVSPMSNRKLYISGQHTIPSDTICFPAKLVHGHIKNLIDKGCGIIFYPCMSYNINEHLGDNHYNCPVVAYYPEVISANMGEISNIVFINDYLGIHRKRDFPIKAYEMLCKYFDGISLKEVKKASKQAYLEYEQYLEKIRKKGDKIIQQAERENKHIIVLAGRPYHIDPEINHGIDKLISAYNAAVISEDSISHKSKKSPKKVLNQWTYHSRLYSAAEYIKEKRNMDLVQLVSFGCGVDAITTDELRDILEDSGKLYTQIKIDEITNLGAVKIRLRSFFAAIGKE